MCTARAFEAGVRRAWAAALLVVVATWGAGCDLLGFGNQQMPSVAYRVTATLMENTCGPQSMHTEPAVTFVANLGLSNGRATWRIPASGAFASGTYNENTGAFRFALQSQVVLIAPDRRTQFPGCVLDRLDVIDGVARNVPAPAPDAGRSDAGGLDASTPPDARPDVADAGVDASSVDGGAADAGQPSTFVATETVVYGVALGADCTAAIGATPGHYTVLPCTQRIEMRAIRNVDVADAN